MDATAKAGRYLRRQPVVLRRAADIVKVEALDNLRVKFYLPEKPNPELPLIIGQIPVLPKHYWDGRDFTKPGLEIPSHHSRKSADTLAGHGIPLMGHRTRSLLSFPERFGGLANLCTLKVPYLCRNFIECSCCNRQCRQKFSVPVTLDHLVGRTPGAYGDIRQRT